jgi:uncharacterized membrane-anchored protein YhcB (DUF1043 family)
MDEDTQIPEPRRSLHTQLQKTKSWVALVAGSIFSIVMIGFQSAQFINSLATKQQVTEMRDYLIKENTKIKEDFDYSKKNEIEMQIELSAVKKAFLDHMEKHSGRLAAEREPNKAKAASSAKEARRKFRESINAGRTIEQALYDSSPDWF